MSESRFTFQLNYMRPVQIILILLFGGLTIFLEFRNTQEWTLFGEGIFNAASIFGLCFLTFMYLFQNTKQYYQQKKITTFLPSALGLLFLVLIGGHHFLRSNNDNSATLFTATNYDLGSDGGFTLDFKKNNHLMGKKIDHFSSTTYRGSYRKLGNTIVLNILLDFKLGKQAIIQKDTLRFMDDTVKFEIFRQ